MWSITVFFPIKMQLKVRYCKKTEVAEMTVCLSLDFLDMRSPSLCVLTELCGMSPQCASIKSALCDATKPLSLKLLPGYWCLQQDVENALFLPPLQTQGPRKVSTLARGYAKLFFFFLCMGLQTVLCKSNTVSLKIGSKLGPEKPCLGLSQLCSSSSDQQRSFKLAFSSRCHGDTH